MAQRALAKLERETRLSLPEFAELPLRWLGSVTIGGKTRKYLSDGVPAFTPQQRRVLEDQILSIRADLDASHAKDNEVKLALLAEMMIALPSQGTSESQVATRSAIYMEVLQDVPAWAVRRAMRNWYAGKTRNMPVERFTWAPSPAMLLQACEDEMKAHKDALHDLKQLLEARHLDETIRELEGRTDGQDRGQTSGPTRVAETGEQTIF